MSFGTPHRFCSSAAEGRRGAAPLRSPLTPPLLFLNPTTHDPFSSQIATTDVYGPYKDAMSEADRVEGLYGALSADHTEVRGPASIRKKYSFLLSAK
jgi:hypothetical protein